MCADEEVLHGTGEGAADTEEDVPEPVAAVDASLDAHRLILVGLFCRHSCGSEAAGRDGPEGADVDTLYIICRYRCENDDSP